MHRLCLHVPAAGLNRARDRVLAANDQEISDDLDNRVTGRAISLDPVDPAIDPAILVGRDNRVIGHSVLAIENSLRIFLAAFRIEISGKIGAPTTGTMS